MIPYPRQVEQGKALIISSFITGTVRVSFTGSLVWPPFHKTEEMDISVKTIEIDRRGTDGLICRDNIRADIKVNFFVRVNKTQEDVIKVAQAIGCVRASSQDTLENLFSAKFSEALKTAGKRLDFEDLYTKRNEFRDMIIEVIGTDLNGYQLEDCAIDYLEQTPLEHLDPSNILDAQGIRKITELTAIQHVKTNEFQNAEKKQIKKQDVEAAEAIYELERQQAEAAARQRREIESVQAREQAETLKVQAEERVKAEQARLKTDETLGIQQENLKREVQVAEKNRERVLAVEIEKVERERMLQVIARERDVELQRIAKDKEIEDQKRDIANVVRERITVEKTVAEQEEAIKRIRVVEEAKRSKEAVVIHAEAEAEELLVKEIKIAQAAEQAATHRAKEQLTLSEAELQSSERRAQAKIRLADGIRAEAAAAGLAQVQVREAEAAAIEKQGFAAARVKEADAEATRKAGFAQIEVSQAEAGAIEKRGQAEALVQRQKGEAQAEIVRGTGLAHAEATREQLKAEADGIAAKADSMRALDERSRPHEEYRLRIDAQKQVDLAELDTRRQVAQAQAQLVAEGLKTAKIDIVGGESVFFDRLVGALSYGKAADRLAGTDTGRALLGDYLDGKASLSGDLKDVLGGIKSGDMLNLTLVRLLYGLAEKADDQQRPRLAKLIETAEKLGLDDLQLGDSKPASRES
jgi:uncharacterized membrane protein YqiK